MQADLSRSCDASCDDRLIVGAIVGWHIEPGRCSQGDTARAMRPGRCGQGDAVRAMPPVRCDQGDAQSSLNGQHQCEQVDSPRSESLAGGLAKVGEFGGTDPRFPQLDKLDKLGKHRWAILL